MLHLHFATSLAGDVADGGILVDDLGRLEEGQRLVMLEQVKAWCGDSHTKVVVKPVIDLAQHIEVPGYDVPDRLRDQVALRDLRVPVVQSPGEAVPDGPRRPL